jgi:hypothetical protein
VARHTVDSVRFTTMSTTINLVAGYGSTGRPAYEEVHVEPCGPATYRLLQSPGLTGGVAAGDVIVVDANGLFKVVERAGNVCIQIYSRDGLPEAEQFATPEFAKIGGRLDGRAPKVLVYTVSVDAGFPAIERVLADIKSRFPSLEWYYGNVYDPADGVTPLNWWLKS